MVTTERRGTGSEARRVLVSNTAANMISSLHPFNRGKADAALERIKSSVLDQTKAKKILGVDNAYVVRAGSLRVIFRKDGDEVVITSIVRRG